MQEVLLMSKQYEDMSKEELITLVKRLGESHNEWRATALEALAKLKLPSSTQAKEMIE